jgi:cytochrome P450
VIAERHQSQTEKRDLMAMLMGARDEDSGDPMNDTELRDEILAMFIAGHETTANTLTWLLYMLAQHPHVEKRVQEEVDAALADKPLSVSTIARLPYTRRVIQETMRLYPTIWNIVRSVGEDDTLDGYTLKSGSMLMVNTYGLHRHPDFWDEPETFNPDRFETDPPRFAYLPFGGGPHICIGNEFAMMEAQFILAQLMHRYRLQLVPGHPVEAKGGSTLYPKHGMKMTIERHK